jgi:hypothetical protein
MRKNCILKQEPYLPIYKGMQLDYLLVDNFIIFLNATRVYKIANLIMFDDKSLHFKTGIISPHIKKVCNLTITASQLGNTP